MFKSMSSVIVLLIIFIAASNSLWAQYDTDTSRSHQIQSGANSNQDMDKMKDHSGMDSKGDLKAAIKKMHTEMKESKLTGDPEKDFAHLMVHHHQCAVDMSQKVVSDGKNAELKTIAQKIIDGNSQDLVVLRRFSGDTEGAAARTGETSGTIGTERTGTGTNGPIGTTGTGTDRTETGTSTGSKGTMGTGTDRTGTSVRMGRISGGIMDGVEDMMDQMDKMETTGDIDKDYASMMIMHHEQSIKMSQNFVSKVSQSDLTSLAQKIIDDSRKEISELEKFSSK